MARHSDVCKGELCGVCQARIDAIEDARYGDPDDGDRADEAADRYFG